MMKNQLIYPMAIWLLYTWCVALYSFRTRSRAVRSGELSIKFFRSYSGAQPPDRVTLVGRHFDNQFQLPVVFLVTCALHMIVADVNDLTVGLAWAFVILRFAHGGIHLGSNNIVHRFVTYGLGWIALLLMWGQLVLNA